MDGDKKDEPMDVEEKKEIAGSQVLRLPQKDHVPQSRGCFESEVRCNLFRMELDANMMVHKYRIDLKKIRKEQEYDLTKGIKSDVASQHRRRICQSIWSDFLKKCEKNGQPLIDDKYCLVYDCANILYAAKRLSLPLEGDCKVFGLALSREEVSSDNTRNYVGKQCEQIVVSIEHTLDFVYSTANEEDKHRETMQFLEVLTSASLNKIGDHFVFGNKYYAKSSRNDVPIGEGKSIKSGFEKSVRIGESEDGKPHCYVQIDAKKSPFFNGVAIPKFCAEYIGARDARDLEHISRSDKSKLNQQLKGLIARTIYTDKSKTRFINVNGLHNENANNTMFEYDGNRVSINDFFKDKYNYKLKYPHLPCIIEKDRQKMSLYPQEVLEIERGQRVSCQKSSRSMAENMIKECRMNPLELKEYIERAIKECLLDRDNKFLKNFKIKVENRWERVAAATLFPPAIKYKSNTVEPQSDGSMRDWNIRNATFLKGGVISKMVFVIFDRAVDKDPARFFLEKILREASNKGMRVPDSRHVEIVNCQSEIVKNLEDIYIDLKSEPHPYIFCVAKNKFDPVHALVKSLEAKHGVVTQQVCNQTLNKAIGQQGAFMVIGNLIQKLNPKAGGVNHAVGLSREHLRKNKNVTDPNLLHPSRMIFGFDISHAGPQSFADRALKIEQSEPSVVGMSFSLEHATHLGGTYWMQAPRFAGLSNVTDRVVKALQTRLKIVGSLPDDIIIYRGGVSEGEFPKVLQEVEQFQGAFQLLKQSPPYNPSVTCIVAMTNSNFRMLPTDINPRAKPHEQNVCSGTVVRTGVVNPQYNEFIIVPQKGIMGTVRPLRCVIVAAVQGSVGKCLNSDDAQQLTHALAYGHQVVNAPTTLPVPLTAATNLTKRGRNNYNEVNHRDQDARSALSGSSGETGQFRHDSTKDYFEKVTDSVKSKLEHHFWA